LRHILAVTLASAGGHSTPHCADQRKKYNDHFSPLCVLFERVQ
jgi:hypothetical protein